MTKPSGPLGISEARELGVCRICKSKGGGHNGEMIYDFGKEFAHKLCIQQPNNLETSEAAIQMRCQTCGESVEEKTCLNRFDFFGHPSCFEETEIDSDQSEWAGLSVLTPEEEEDEYNEDQIRIAKIGKEVIETLLRKNQDYGSSIYQVPVLAPECDPGTAIRIRMSDKINRFVNLMRSNKRRIQDETVQDTIRDLVGYGILLLALEERNERD